MRNPNGYGSVYKLSGNRRKPFIARKTIGWDENGKQLYQTIGYFEKRAEALAALGEFNQNPHNLEASAITFSDLFDMWKEQKYKKISKSNIKGYNASYKICRQLHDMKFVEIRSKNMQDVINTCAKNHSTLRKIKVLFNQLYKFAMENDIVVKDYSRYVDIGKRPDVNSRKVFTRKEIARLFEVVNDFEYADTVLIMIYTGLRIGELLTVETANVDMEKKYMVGGIKTEAGKNRIIPINNKILDLIRARYETNNKYLISSGSDAPIKYLTYYRKFKLMIDQLGFDHSPHDCRHTFATLMSEAKANTVSLQKIIGHASYATTANIYTHKDIDQLLQAVNLI